MRCLRKGASCCGSVTALWSGRWWILLTLSCRAWSCSPIPRAVGTGDAAQLNQVTRPDGEQRSAITTVLFLLGSDDVSRWHCVHGGDEIWTFLGELRSACFSTR